MDEKFDDRLWAVVTAGNTRYLGVVGKDDATSQASVLEDIESGNTVLLTDGCELPLPAQLTPQGFARIPLAVPIDLTLDSVPIHLSRVSSIYFIADLSKDDQQTLLKIRAACLNSVKEQKAARAGLVLR